MPFTKRLFALILCIALCFTVLPLSVFAEEVTASPISAEESEDDGVPDPDAISVESDDSLGIVDAENYEDAVKYFGILGDTYISERELSDSTPIQLMPLLTASPETDLSGEEEPVSREEAVTAFADAIQRREETVTLRYQTFWSGELDENAFIYSEYHDLVRSACAHDPAIPDGGDYRYYNIRSYGATVLFKGSPESFVTITYTYTLEYYTTVAQEQWVTDRINSIVQSFGFTGESEYEKVRTIYDWICANVTYTRTVGGELPRIAYSAYSALYNGNAVCQGFSTLLYRLCLECGVDSRVITSESMNHAYNILRLGDLYYYSDATWDYLYYPGAYRYFLRGSVNWVGCIPSPHEPGDEFADEVFAGLYPVSPDDYELFLPGDMTGDGNVDNADILRLMNYIKARGIGVTLASPGDVNNDGSVNNADTIRLMKYVKARGEKVA